MEITTALLIAVITIIGGVGSGMIFILRLFIVPLKQEIEKLAVGLELRRQDDRLHFAERTELRIKVAYLEGFLTGAHVLNGGPTNGRE